MRRVSPYWICQIAGWSLYALINMGIGVAGGGDRPHVSWAPSR